MTAYKLIRYFRLPRYEHLYIMADPFNLPYRAKCGISCDGDIRKGQVQQSIKNVTGMDVKLYHVRLPVLFARQNEKLVHWMLKRFRYNGLRDTSGWSEWVWSLNVLTFVLSWILFAQMGVKEPMWKAGFMMLLPLPIDCALIIFTLALVQYAAIFGVFYLLLYFVFA